MPVLHRVPLDREWLIRLPAVQPRSNHYADTYGGLIPGLE